MTKQKLKRMTKDELEELHFDTLMDTAYLTRGIKFHKDAIKEQVGKLGNNTTLLDAVDEELESRESKPTKVSSVNTNVN